METIKKDERRTVAAVGNDAMEMSVGFVRQRRNLMLCSVIVYLLSYTDASVESSITVLGVGFNLSQAIDIKFISIIFLAYFLCRYLQYLNQEEKISLTSLYLNYFRRHMDSVLKEIAINEIKKHEKTDVVINPHLTDIHIRPILFPLVKNTQGYHIYSGSGKEVYVRNEVPFYKSILDVVCNGYYDRDNKHIDFGDNHSLKIYIHKEINLFYYWRHHIKAIFSALFATTYFSDYYFPLLLASFAAVKYTVLVW